MLFFFFPCALNSELPFLLSFDLAHVFSLPYTLFEGLTLTQTRNLVLTAGFAKEGRTIAHEEYE